MNTTVVSIVCTNYNKGHWIGEAIESFLRQKTSFSYEIVLIDDASTDNSRNIIRKYEKSYPDKIRAFYNDTNLGITKTWIKICKEAKGTYIARCDGDDYWLDDKKLQKQVELLESNSDSKWSSTDCDTISPEGKVMHRSAFETGYINRPKSYAEMFATRGFTAPSSWLVDAELMRSINSGLNPLAVDDTFNIQLDLFNLTKLSYLPEAMVAYRVNEGSDSRPMKMSEITSRSERLLETQLEYIDKYNDADFAEMMKILLARDTRHELMAIERLQLVVEHRKQAVAQQEHIKNLEKHIDTLNDTIATLGTTIDDIVNSRRYKVANKTAGMARKIATFPSKVKKNNK